MQSFTKTEITWMIGELDKCAIAYLARADKPCSYTEKGLLNLRSENCVSLSQKLTNALKSNDKRIEIKY